MATTTPNFGWAVPTSTDLVKDGAVAIETLGDAIDASLVDLKGGTTNQVLAKNSNTDMDFKWVADSAGMTNPMTTTGDTIYSSSGSTPARLGIGSTGQVLTVSGGLPSWATPASGSGLTLITAQTVTSSSTISVNNVFTNTYQNYTVYFQLLGTGGAQNDFRLRVGGSDNSDSVYVCQKLDVSNTTVSAVRATSTLFDNAYFTASRNAANRINFYQPFETAPTYVECHSSINGEEIKFADGLHTNSTSFDGFSLLNGENVSGTVWVYGWKETV